jgi:hypothetical protein
MGCPRAIREKLRRDKAKHKKAAFRGATLKSKGVMITTDAHFPPIPVPEYDRLRCEADQEPSVFYWGNMTTIYLRKSK